MEDAQPTMDIGGMQSGGSQYDAPSQPPPPAVAGGSGMATQPFATARAMAAPPDMQAAPSLPATAGRAAGLTAWQNNKTLDGLWTINQDRNSWMSVAGIGWKKLANPNETALSALTMLAAHARCVNATINYRDEADNMVHEIYVW